MKLLRKRELSAGQVAQLREFISRERCPRRPGFIGLTHHWQENYLPDSSSFGSVIQFWTCRKCGLDDGL